MSTLNLPKINLSAESIARFLGLMLVAWQPFVSGARLPFILLLLLGVWMLWRKRIDFSSAPVKRLSIVFLLLGIPVLISIPGSFHPQASINIAIVMVFFYVVGLALLQGLVHGQDHAWLQRWLLIVVMAWVADGYIQYLFGHDLLGIPLSEDQRILGPFAGNLHFGLFITVLMPVIFWRLARQRPWLSLALIGLLGFMAGMSGARSNILFFLLACTVLLPRFGWRQRTTLAAAVVATIIAAAVLSPSITERLVKSEHALQTTTPALEQKLDAILTGRITIWETAWNMVKGRPLTGVGAGAFAEAYDDYSPRADDPYRTTGSYGSPTHAHQMYVSVAAESGWPGLAGLIAVIVLCGLWFFRAPADQRRQAAPYAASLAVIAFPIQSQPVLYTIWWFPIVQLMLCGMIAAMSNTHTSEGKDGK
jgi:O-antigen ligase